MTTTFNSTEDIIAALTADLADARKALIERASSIPDEQFLIRPDENAWSPGEILAHISLVDGNIGGLLASLLERTAAEEKTKEIVDVEGKLEIVLPAITITPDPIQTSERATPQREVSRPDVLAKLAEMRESLLQVLRDSSPFDMSGIIFPHPVLGDLNFYQWFSFVAEHERRHTGQIERAIEQIEGVPDNRA